MVIRSLLVKLFIKIKSSCEHKEATLIRHAAKCKECGVLFETKS